MSDADLNDIDLSDYRGSRGEMVLTWSELNRLIDGYPPTGELRKLLVAIQYGHEEDARDACACLLAGDKP